MLVALRPEFVAKHWGEIGSEFGRAMPPVGINSGFAINVLLERILSGEVTVWIVTDSEGVVKGFIATIVTVDRCTDTKSLLIYILVGDLTIELWRDGSETLREYAKSRGCVFINGFCKNRGELVILKSLGADIEYRLVTWEV